MPENRLIVINLSQDSDPPRTAFILLTSMEVEDLLKQIRQIISDNFDVIPHDLGDRLREYGEVFTEWEGVLLNADIIPAESKH